MATEDSGPRRRPSHGGGVLVGEPSVVNFDGSVLSLQPAEAAGQRTQPAGAGPLSYTGVPNTGIPYAGPHQAAHGLVVHGNGHLVPGREVFKSNSTTSGSVSALRLSPERSNNEVLPYSYVGIPSSNNSGTLCGCSTFNALGKVGGSSSKPSLSSSPHAAVVNPAVGLSPMHRHVYAGARFQGVGGGGSKPSQAVPVHQHGDNSATHNNFFASSSATGNSNSTQVPTSTAQQMGNYPLTPPSVAGFSCAPRMDGAWGGLPTSQLAPPTERRKSVDLRNNYNSQQQQQQQPQAVTEGKGFPSASSYQIHVAGRGFGKHPGQAIADRGITGSPFKPTVSGMSVKLASLNTKFSQDLLQQHEGASPTGAAYMRFLPSAASDESFSGSVGGRDPVVTILGSQRSAGNWWSQDDLSALPFEHARRSPGEARFSDDGFLSEYSRPASWDGASLSQSSEGLRDLTIGC